jgi:hypothetical protein
MIVNSQREFVLDRILGAIIKQLGAISSLQQEGLACRHIRQLVSQSINLDIRIVEKSDGRKANLDGRYERWELAQLA